MNLSPQQWAQVESLAAAGNPGAMRMLQIRQMSAQNNPEQYVTATENIAMARSVAGTRDGTPAADLLDLLVPVVHGITYEELRDESPLLASRSGLDTAEDSMEEIAVKISELVSTDAFDGSSA